MKLERVKLLIGCFINNVKKYLIPLLANKN